MIAFALEVDVEAEAIYLRTGFRCCTLAEFSGWREMALKVNATNAAHHPGSARQFCYDCIPMVRKWMAEQGRCVRASKVADKEP